MYQNLTARGYLAAIDPYLKSAPRHAEYPESVFAISALYDAFGPAEEVKLCLVW
jgi:hypothetical protein